MLEYKQLRAERMLAIAGLNSEFLARLVEQVGGVETAKRIVCRDLQVSTQEASNAEWEIDQFGCACFSVESDGRWPEEWNDFLDYHGRPAGKHAKKALSLPDLPPPTIGVKYKVRVILGSSLLIQDEMKAAGMKRINTQLVRDIGQSLGLGAPHWEVACLMAEMFTDEDMRKMGVTKALNILSDPIPGLKGGGVCFSLIQDSSGGQFGAPCGDPEGTWIPEDGFALVEVD